ncbi:MAG TPA: nucleoside-diphosphate kinase [Candidatus Sumerlaeota bacterium]|nr:nucleoside-diphosphate kinase [Candidatus Sumerlaeota bacterium]HPS03394.1 nucleoside-diphosphate kinase [Candidatus Sumerlaeota bacterium]
MFQRTLVLIKPDAVQRRLSAEILGRFESKGLRIVGMKMLRFTPELARRHYAEHIGKSFYPRLEEFICSGPCVALVLESEEVIALVRRMMGATDRLEALPGTIRGDYAYASTEQNLIHGSDSGASAEREIPIFFQENELFPPES